MKQPVTIAMLLLFSLGSARPAKAQDNYEIQVYGSQTISKGQTIVELHSNTSLSGSTVTENEVLPTQHAIRETIEITHGFNSFFEIGVYFFSNISPGRGCDFVGSHIRPRVMVPETWKWPVGVSLSLEAGKQKRIFAEDNWSLEIRPIIDKTIGNFYISLNPTLEKSLDDKSTPVFSPNVKWSYTFRKLVAIGNEYYGSTGPFNAWNATRDQQHLIMFALDWYFSPKWEVNMAYGRGITPNTDGTIIKLLIGRKF